MHLHSLKQCGTPPRPDACFVASLTFCAHAALLLFLLSSLSCSWHTYMLLVYMHEVPHLSSKHGIKRMDRYDQLAEYVWGEWLNGSVCGSSGQLGGYRQFPALTKASRYLGASPCAELPCCYAWHGFFYNV
jgi:hypothetical protein